MAPTYEYGTIIILDIGRFSSSPDDKVTFFERAKQCATRIIERNIMIQTKNLVGLVLMGSKTTKNELAEQCPGAFKYIDMVSEMRTPTWQMIRDLPQETTQKKSDWFEALIVAAHHYKEGVSGCKIKSRKIVLITNFLSPARIGNNFDEVVNGFQEENFEIYVIGPDLESQEGKDIDTIRHFINQTNGDTATFDEAMSGWLFHKKKGSKMVPQHYDLSIGPNIRIPVAIYIRIKDEPVLKSWQKAIKDPITLSASTTEGVKTEKQIINAENQSIVPNTNTITGYQYGQAIIPLSSSDEAMLYQSGEKSMSIYGFTKSDRIQWQVLNGECTYYILARKGDTKGQNAINCLVQCLHELDCVGLVRKVYCKNSEPKMFALMPVIDTNGFICLSMVGICYKEAIKNMAFPTSELKKFSCSEEQVNAFKDLINSMDLTNAYDDSFNDSEAFPIGETVSPSIQYILDCISYRALNPDKPLPQPRDEIMTLFKVPPLIEKRSRDPIETLKKLFTLKKVEKKKGTKRKMPDPSASTSNGQTNDVHSPSTSSDMPKFKLPTLNTTEVTHIGTIKPSQDFLYLLSQGKSLPDLSKEMTEVIENLVYTNFTGDYAKVLDAMKTFRGECVRSGPSHYNVWLLKFKGDLVARKRDSFITNINESNVNFILKSENSESTYTEESADDSELYENDTIPNSTEINISSEVNDMFDEM